CGIVSSRNRKPPCGKKLVWQRLCTMRRLLCVYRNRLLRESSGLKLAFALVLATFAVLPQRLQASSRVTFPQGVASGDVTPFSAVLWTRVQPAAPDSSSQEALIVEVALDSGFRRIHFKRTV